MYPNYINKPSFMSNTPNTNFGASTSTFGQPATNAPMFSSMQPSSMFQTTNTSSFNPGPAASTFGSNLFGQQQPSTSGLFGNSFGQNKATFGFGSTPAQTGLFGQQPQQPTGSSLFQSNATNLFGSSNAFGNQTHTGTVLKFSPVTGTDTMQKNGVTQSISTKHHCITCMKEYENKSLEELRFEDYSANRKGPQQQSSFPAAPFASATTGAAPSLFGQADNKQGFGQTSTFGQTTSFGQSTPGFGVTNAASAPTLFGKPTFGTTTTTNTFGFNTPSTTTNPFNANQAAKPFSQPLFGTNTSQPQASFGTGVFGQTANQNTTNNLFPKPVQPTTGFNTGQPGFSFNQTGTTQSSALFQVSKPNTGFGIFGQTNTGTTGFGQTSQPTFGANFGKLTTTSFAQPIQPSFGTTLGGGIQQQPLFGNTANKPTTLFGNTNAGTSLFSNNVFQPTPTSFSLNMNAQQPTQFPPEPSNDSKNISLIATDIFPDGPHVYGLEPLLNDNSTSTTNPQDLKAMLDYSKKREELLGTRAKIKVHLPKPKRGNNFNREFFETNQALKSSHKSLVIRKFSDNNSTIYNKYKNELIEEAEECLRSTNGSETDSFETKIILAPRSIGFTEEENTVTESEFDSPSSTSLTSDNPAGVILSKPEYYMYPAVKDLYQYMDENGECIVQGLTIGRRGYGNVYFPDAIDVTNLNIDEIVHFRHREVIVYPDDSKKPPIGEGLNRRAQVTLDKIFPREKGSGDYIMETDKIIQSNFVDNLMHVTQKHSCKFVDYRPKTGSWVFKVKHFSKYAFTDSDEEECEVSWDKPVMKKSECIQTIVELEELPKQTLGGTVIVNNVNVLSHSDSDSFIHDSPSMLDYWRSEVISTPKEVEDSPKESLSGPLIINSVSNILTPPEQEEFVQEAHIIEYIRSEVISVPKIHKLPNMSVGTLESIQQGQRCYTELGMFKSLSYKVPWTKGLNFYNMDVVPENEIQYRLTYNHIKSENDTFYNTLMPHLTDMLNITLQQSKFSMDNKNIPTLDIDQNLTYLQKQTALFNDHVRKHSLSGREKYLCSVWNLCTALWGEGDKSFCGRRQNLSDWLNNFSYDLSPDKNITEHIEMRETDAFATIFKLLSFHKIAEASDFAARHNLEQLSLLISQLNANETYKFWMRKNLSSFVWKEDNVIPDQFKKLVLLLSGIPFDNAINICDGLEWLRCFGLHLWYVAPSAAPINVAFNLYKNAFDGDQYATKPIPPYCGSASDSDQYDLLYHILALYTNSTYQLCYVLHPETHTENVIDYRLSWFLMQLFLSLNVGLIRETEQEYMHTTFSTQLENMGQWKWAIFVLLFVKNNTVKKNLIFRILDRNLSTFTETSHVEQELVNIFKIPPAWIHEVKATKAKMSGYYYEYFEHYVHMKDWHKANDALVDIILPELFINEQYGDLRNFIDKMEPASNSMVNWNTQGGLFKDFIELNEILCNKGEEAASYVAGKLCSLFRRINSFPYTNDRQRLCVAELSRRCALIFKFFYKNLEGHAFQAEFLDLLNNLIMPSDIKHHEINYIISRYVRLAQ